MDTIIKGHIEPRFSKARQTISRCYDQKLDFLGTVPLFCNPIGSSG